LSSFLCSLLSALCSLLSALCFFPVVFLQRLYRNLFLQKSFDALDRCRRPEMVVIRGMLCATATDRMETWSRLGRRPVGVLMIRSISRFLIKSTMLGLPSWTLLTLRRIPFWDRALAVPRVRRSGTRNRRVFWR